MLDAGDNALNHFILRILDFSFDIQCVPSLKLLGYVLGQIYAFQIGILSRILSSFLLRCLYL